MEAASTEQVARLGFRSLLASGLLLAALTAAAVVVGNAGGTQAASASDLYPKIGAAGDIACSPDDPKFRDGAGTANECHQRRTSELLVSRGFDAVLTLGDNQYLSGELGEYLGSYDPSWGRVKSMTFPSPGNHEYRTPGAEGYFDYFNGPGAFSGPAGARDQGFYSFDIGAWHLISLNSNCSEIGGCGAGSLQYQWLKSDLAQAPNRCVLAYWHRPVFSSGPHGSSNVMKPTFRRLYEAHADVVLTGHDHIYERFAPQNPDGEADPAGPREFVVGTGGREHYAIVSIQPNSVIRENKTFGVLALVLKDRSYKWRFVPETPTEIDSGSAPCVA